MRISTQQIWQASLADVRHSTANQAEAREQITSGKRLHRISDDPTAATRSVALRAEAEAIDQYKRAGQEAVAFMNAQDRTLQAILNRMGREFTLIAWIDNWGETVGIGIRIGMVLVGAGLWLIGKKGEPTEAD